MKKLLLVFFIAFGLSACTEKNNYNIEQPTIPSSNELTVNPSVVYVERPIYIFLCGDLMITDETPDISSNDELVIDVPVYIELESDDPRCIEAKKNND
jgi:hypothetical protein